MGHLSGQIADIVFESRALHDGLDYHVDAHGSYVRRRLVPAAATQAAERLANVAFWPVVPPIANPAHRSGPLSAVFLALSLAPLGRRLIAEPIRLKHVGPPPYRRGAHLRNLVLDLPRTLGFAPAFLWRNRVARMRLPGFFLATPPGATASSTTPSSCRPGQPPDARGGRDGLGQRRLRIDLRFCARPTPPAVVRAHAALEAWLGAQPPRPARALRAARGARRAGAGRTPGTAPTRSAPSAWATTAATAWSTRGCRSLRGAEPPRGLDRGAADLRPGQPDADRGAARPAPRPPQPAARAQARRRLSGHAPAYPAEDGEGDAHAARDARGDRHRDLLPRLRLRLARQPGRRRGRACGAGRGLRRPGSPGSTSRRSTAAARPRRSPALPARPPRRGADLQQGRAGARRRPAARRASRRR